MLALYDSPAEHPRHLRTSHPIESMFATVQQGTSEAGGAAPRDATLSVVFKSAMCWRGRWRRLNGDESLRAPLRGVPIQGGAEADQAEEGDASA